MVAMTVAGISACRAGAIQGCLPLSQAGVHLLLVSVQMQKWWSPAQPAAGRCHSILVCTQLTKVVFTCL